MPLLDLGSVKSQLKIPATSSGSDTILLALMDAVTSVVEGHTGQTLDQRSFSQEMYLSDRTRRIRVLNTPLVLVSSITDDMSGDPVDLTGAVIRKSGLIVLQNHLSLDTYL